MTTSQPELATERPGGLGTLLRPQPRMWWKCVAGIPRVGPEQWRRLDLLSRWLIASRAGVMVITLLPCLIAGILAFRDGIWDTRLWLVVTAGLLLSHATNNILNDLTDYLKGVDRGSYFRARYGPQPLEHGLMTVRQSASWAAITGAAALACGLYLVAVRGGVTLHLLLAGCFFVLFYTWPLKYIGLGEIAVIVVWGPLMIGGAYYVLGEVWSWPVVWLSLVYALGPTTVIFGKHIDKLEEDRAKKIRTLPVLLGERASRGVAMAMLVLPYLLVAGLVLFGLHGPALLVVLLALPKLRQSLGIFREPRPAEPPAEYPREAWPLWFVSFAFVHNRAFGSLFMLGLLVDVLIVRFA